MTAYSPTQRPNLLLALRHRWVALDRVQRGFVWLMLLRLALALLFMLNILPLELRWKWYLHHGGDQEVFLGLALSILKGQPQTTLVAIGQALMMMPWIVLLKPYNYFDIVVPLVLINGFLLGGLSVLLVGDMARRTTDRRGVATCAALAWAILPLLAYYGFFWHPAMLTLRAANVPKLGWLNGLADAPATFFMLLAVYLLARSLEDRPHLTWRMVGVGAAMGAALMFRVHIAPMVGFVLLYVLVAHGWRSLLVVCGAGVLTYIPQAWYNMSVFSMPFTTGYSSMWDPIFADFTGGRPLIDRLRNLPFHPRHLLDLWNYFIGRRPWLIIPLALAALAGLIALIDLWRVRGWRAVALLIGVPLAYLGPMATAWPFREDVIRFTMPALPYLFVALAYAAGRAGQWVGALGLTHARSVLKDLPSQR
jgi:hypothetical protein